MGAALIISNLLLWFVVIILLLAVLALARQIGVLHERVAPVGALMPMEGPRIGELVTPLDAPLLAGGNIRIGGEQPIKTFIYFLSPTCPICKSLLPAVRSLAEHENDKIKLIFASDGDDVATHQQYAKEQDLGGYDYVLSQPLGLALGVNKLPFAVLINEQGVLRGRGLVNSREHLESLLQADEIGVASLQEYLGISEKTAL